MVISLLGKIFWQLLTQLDLGLPCDSAILLLVMYPKELKEGTQVDACTLCVNFHSSIIDNSQR
jgi:hypothetical protein